MQIRAGVKVELDPTAFGREILPVSSMKEKRHTIVVDLGFGDAGKGTIVDFLARVAAASADPVTTVVRFNGGAQAGHNVVTPDGRAHTFRQFGAGTFAGAATHLSHFVLVEPLALAAEAEQLLALGVTAPFARLTIDRRALLTTPYHVAANRAREQARGASRHGSCGVGIGETVAYALIHPDDAPRVADTTDLVCLRHKLLRLADTYRDTFGVLAVPSLASLLDVYAAFASTVRLVDETYLPRTLAQERVLFEAAQGVLLDEWWGFHPYTTWSTTTFANAETLLAEAGQAESATRIGVLRAYTTRHGAGPFPTEDADLTRQFPDRHNGDDPWQGAFRVGHLDLVLHRYALTVAGGVDYLALTHLDRAAVMPELRVCDAYTVNGRQMADLSLGLWRDRSGQEERTALLGVAQPYLRSFPVDLPAMVGLTLGAPVGIESWGPTAREKRLVTQF